MDINKAIANGYGERLYNYISDDEDAKFAIKKYAINDLICVPIEISVYSGDNRLLDNIDCSVNEDISDFTTGESEDVYLSTLNLKRNLSSALEGCNVSAEYAKKALEKTDFSQDGVKREKSLYPTKAVVNSASVDNGYAFIYSAVVDTSSSSFVIFAAAAILWLVPIAVIGVAMVATGRR